MRFAPAAAALSLCLAISASVLTAGVGDSPDPRAAALVAQGQAALNAGETQAAIDAFEAALAVDPSYAPIYIDLGEAARQSGLQGKAIRYYREALARHQANWEEACRQVGASFLVVIAEDLVANWNPTRWWRARCCG